MSARTSLSGCDPVCVRARLAKRRRGAGFAALLTGISLIGLIGSCTVDLDAILNPPSPERTAPEPALRISPARGPVLGRTKVTIVGTDAPAFGAGTQVLFGAFLASDLEVVDSRTIRVMTPP